jgi:hypothetical protein
MSRVPLPSAYQSWRLIVLQKMPHLSKPQAVVLALWSFGIALTQCCGLSTVSVFLAELLGKRENTVREQLRQWYQERSARAGRKRAERAVTQSFAPLLAWILSGWPPAEKRLVLVADASNLGQRFTVLLICVVYRGCGLPVAWKVVRGTDPGSWQPHWLTLLKSLKGCIPEDWWVLVTTDRGLYAKWFYEAIQALQWHPFMRINAQGHYVRAGEINAQGLETLITQVGQAWSGWVQCFKTHPVDGTLFARWEEGSESPWLILTDLAPEEAQISWYGMRSWIECLFKDIKRGGWGWPHTKMQDPQRVERLWLAMAVAMIWVVSVGGQADAGIPVSSHSPPAQGHPPLSSSPGRAAPFRPAPSLPLSEPHPLPHPRWLSCLKRGFLVLLAAVVRGQPIPVGRFFPEPFPMPQPRAAPG